MNPIRDVFYVILLVAFAWLGTQRGRVLEREKITALLRPYDKLLSQKAGCKDGLPTYITDVKLCKLLEEK